MLRVLIVEDDPRVAAVNEGFVDRVEGFAVAGVVGSVPAAMAAVESVRPDLIILDLYLTEGNGLDLLRVLRSQADPADVIVVTAAKESSALQEALRAGVVDYILKPYRFERFSEALHRYRQYRLQLQSSDQVQQEQVDRLLAHRPFTAVSPMPVDAPKGIDELTLRLVLETLNACDSWLTAEEFGARTGLSRTTARRYLEYLVESGQAVVRAAYGSIGRPERRYRRRI